MNPTTQASYTMEIPQTNIVYGTSQL